MCGISGVLTFNGDNVVKTLYNSLFNLQHRGQEASGMHVCSEKMFKSNLFGLIEKQLPYLENVGGYMGIGHVRYPTSGAKTSKEIQPFSIIFPYDISLVHNGNITNQTELYDFLKENKILCETTSDSEIIFKLFCFFVEENFEKLTEMSIFNAVHKIFNMCRGSYSVIIMIKDYGLVVFKDRYGIKPLSYCEVEGELITFSSETSGLSGTSYKDVLNGEIIIINKNGKEKINCLKNHVSTNIRPCLFEYIYFARQDSYINDILVYEFRKNIGIKIASIIDRFVLDNIDFVLPVPQTSIISACSLANVINKPIEHAIIKNRYTHRTFINSGKEILENIKKIKVIEKIVYDKNVLIVDDSIVRGNTSKYIIEELKRAGVKKIYFACCSPPIIYPNVYGIAIPTTNELLAHGKTTKQIANILGVDQLYYLPLDIMCDTLTEINPSIKLFENSVFTGNYI